MKFKPGDVVECIERLNSEIDNGMKFTIQRTYVDDNIDDEIYVDITSVRTGEFFKGVYEYRFKLDDDGMDIINGK